MPNPFFDKPILNSPCEYPGQHWDLDPSGMPTGTIVDRRRRVSLITPVPKPKKLKAQAKQEEIVFEGCFRHQVLVKRA